MQTIKMLIFSFIFVLTAGCATTPDTTALMENAQATKQTPLVVDGKGALPKKESKALVADLKEDVGNLDILNQHIALEQAVTGTPLVAGNTATLLRDGPVTYQAMLKAMREAKDNINIETYIFFDDAAGNKFIDLLEQKQKSGVQVNIIYDSVGSLETDRAFFDRLKTLGGNVLEFNPINPTQARKGWNINHRDHRKLTIVDGKIAFVGGINISNVYSRGSSFLAHAGDDKIKPTETAWRDTHVEMRGPVVEQFQRLFMESWAKQHGPELPKRNYFPKLKNEGDYLIHAIGTSPDAPNVSMMYTTLLSAINSAQNSVYITNAYFAPAPEILQALEDAARRKVDVQLLLPGISDNWLPLNAGRSHYAKLLDAGVKIFQRKYVMLHAKTSVIDNVWSTIGSTNLDWRSTAINDEIDAVILSKDFADQMRAQFERDKLDSVEVTKQSWSKRPVMMHLKEWAARFWERFL